MNTNELIEEKIQQRLREIRALSGLQAILPTGGIALKEAKLSFGMGTLDIDNPTREDATKLIAAVKGGIWDKTTNGNLAGVDYTTRTEILPGYRLRLWDAQPPNTCRIVEEEVEVPAVPAHKEVRRRIVCNEGMNNFREQA